MNGINTFLRLHPRSLETDLVELIRLYRRFVDEHESNLEIGEDKNYDDLSCTLYLFADKEARKDSELTLLILRTLKILLRKEANRRQIDVGTVQSIIEILKFPRSGDIAGETCNVVLNMCYEKGNIDKIVRLNGVQPLIAFLPAPDGKLQASACGALQSICYQKNGRDAALALKCIPRLIALLNSTDRNVVCRSVGALHNLSSNSQSVDEVKEMGGIPILVGLLDLPDGTICASAAGTLQNLSRDKICRDEILSLGATAKLVDLLFGDNVNAQVSAAGALLNMLGFSPMGVDDASRKQLKTLLSDALALGAVYSSVFKAGQMFTT